MQMNIVFRDLRTSEHVQSVRTAEFSQLNEAKMTRFPKEQASQQPFRRSKVSQGPEKGPKIGANSVTVS